MVKSSIKPKMEVTLEKGSKSLFTKKFKYEKIVDEMDIKFQVQLVITSMLEGRNFRKVLWGYHPSFQSIDVITN
jgi:hypothetical protein